MNINTLKSILIEIEKAYRVQEYQIEQLLKENEQLKKDAKMFVDKKLKDENNSLKRRLSMSIGEFDSKKELKAYEHFCNEHVKCQLSSKANGGKIPYVILNGTGIGSCKKVVCQVCGAEKDITDISVW